MSEQDEVSESVYDGPTIKLPYREAYMWRCGDEYCDCTRPVIELRTQNLNPGSRWTNITREWEGTFHSGADSEEREQQRAELAKACAERGLEPGTRTPADDISWADVQRIHAEKFAKDSTP